MTVYTASKSFNPEDQELHKYLKLWKESKIIDKGLLAKEIMEYLKGTYPFGNPYAALQLHQNYLVRQQIIQFKTDLANAPLGLVVPMFPKMGKTG